MTSYFEASARRSLQQRPPANHLAAYSGQPAFAGAYAAAAGGRAWRGM